MTVSRVSFRTHPTTLFDPVAQPPVTKGDTSCGGQEEDHVEEKDKRTSCCFDVGTIHRPADITRASFFSFHQFSYIKKRKKSLLTKKIHVPDSTFSGLSPPLLLSSSGLTLTALSTFPAPCCLCFKVSLTWIWKHKEIKYQTGFSHAQACPVISLLLLQVFVGSGIDQKDPVTLS